MVMFSIATASLLQSLYFIFVTVPLQSINTSLIHIRASKMQVKGESSLNNDTHNANCNLPVTQTCRRQPEKEASCHWATGHEGVCTTVDHQQHCFTSKNCCDPSQADVSSQSIPFETLKIIFMKKMWDNPFPQLWLCHTA